MNLDPDNSLERKNKALENEIRRHKKSEDQLRRSYERLAKLVRLQTDELRQAINEREKMEAQLRHSQKLEALGTLAGGIAHDFKNILCAIIGNTEMALSKLDEPEQAKAFIARTLKATGRANDLVNQILAFSKKSSQEKQPILPHLITNETLDLLRASLPANIEIQKFYDYDSGVVFAVQTQFHQVLVNLCTNAAHAMEESGGGILRVELANVEIPDEELVLEKNLSGGEYVRLTVSDTGTGMDQATRERIFDPYFTTKEFGKGNGLGLSVVHGIVKNHGGMVQVESKPGSGTSFHVFFPKSIENVYNLETCDEELACGKEHILLVDDEQEIVEIKKDILEELGYHVTAMTDSTQALVNFRLNPGAYDLVITDQIMPGLSGTELAQELLKLRPDIRIILFTGYHTELSEISIQDYGIHEYVLKPINRAGLARIVRQTLDCAL